jgi:hypothetical protein
VEIGIRDRLNYPLPQDVSLADLMSFSYFRGENAEKLYDEYCVQESKPLEKDMIHIGEKWYNNKFNEVKKIIVNHVLPKFLNILNKLRGGPHGTKSG